MGQLEDRVAVITGGASGIGRSCAKRFATEGASVVIGDLNLDRAAEAVAEIEAGGGTAHAVCLDSAEVEDTAEMIATALDKYGRLDAVVAAAGLSHAGYVSGESAERANDGLLEISIEDWQRMMDVNLTGVMLTNQQAARAMVESGNGGTIVNIASVAARRPLAGAVDYCVSKAGAWMLTKGLALELAPHNVRVNAIGPGFVETPMTARMGDTDEGAALMAAMTPMGRLGTPIEIANTALFLSTEESSYFTGQMLHPAGGMFTD